MVKEYKINSEDVTFRIIDDEVVILHLKNGHYYSLNKVGSKIWKAIDKKKNFSEILDYLKEEFQLPERRLKNDLLGLVKDLKQEKLIECVK